MKDRQHLRRECQDAGHFKAQTKDAKVIVTFSEAGASYRHRCLAGDIAG